jgi:hypothetical protein
MRPTGTSSRPPAFRRCLVTMAHYTALPSATLALTAHTRPGPRSPETPVDQADRSAKSDTARSGHDSTR